ncbi:COG3650 family protein [Bernardetia sp. OM2101]|uniref:COG3650 family protein n=1 Tax=Bernardetia sp. OM2101 TaxID=3344876 RepID=UPI0035CE911C
MKFIIPIFILFLCFSCDSPSKSHASTDESDKKVEEKNEEQKKVKKAPIQIGTDEVLFKSFGTEPFWSAEVRKSGILFSKYGLDSITFEYVEPKAAESRPIEYFMTYFLEDQDGKQAQLVVKKGEECACSDGMSDKDYGYHTFFLYDNQMFEGCGEKSVTSEE